MCLPYLLFPLPCFKLFVHFYLVIFTFSQSLTLCTSLCVQWYVSSCCFQCSHRWSSDFIFSYISWSSSNSSCFISFNKTVFFLSSYVLAFCKCKKKKKKERHNCCVFKTLIVLCLDINFSHSMIMLSDEYSSSAFSLLFFSLFFICGILVISCTASYLLLFTSELFLDQLFIGRSRQEEAGLLSS